jgi:hypothetical protein
LDIGYLGLLTLKEVSAYIDMGALTKPASTYDCEMMTGKS